MPKFAVRISKLMSNILISGDSWSLGEIQMTKYSKKLDLWYDPRVMHRGINQYFTDDHHTITNVGIGGGNNARTIESLKKAINDDCDFIFFIQTDPFRELIPEIGVGYESNKIKDFYSSTPSKFLAKQQELLDIAYNKLNSLNKKIYCLGGTSKIDLPLISNYSNLIPLIPAITELLCPDYQHPELWVSAWRNQIANIQNKDLVELIMENFNRQKMLKDNYPHLFWPDGHHPNRHGHRIIYDYICRELHIGKGK